MAVTSCNDGNACTSDSCDPATGNCVYDKVPMNGAACSDGDLGTQTDTCAAGVCTGSNPKTCTALDQCHIAGTCASSTGLCSNPNKTDGTGCDDANTCTLGDVCSAGVCSGPTALDCNDNIACTKDSCAAATGCAHDGPAMNGVGCDDGNACTLVDLCSSGGCVGGSPKVCTAQDQCHVAGTCASATGVCSQPIQANGTACNDANGCTVSDTCQAGICTSGGAKPCADSNPCTDDSCSPPAGTCLHDGNTGNACDDGNACTDSDKCAGGSCTGVSNGCADNNVCTDDACQSGTTCSHTNNTAVCEDGNLCTLTDRCSLGVCQAGTQMVCNDSNVCTAGDYCAGGNCLPGAAISCDDNNACTTDSCHATLGCQYGDNGGAVCGDYGVCGGGQCACPGGFAIQGGHCQPVLTGISLAGATLSPVFDAGTTAYTATVPLATSSPNVTVTAPAGVSVTLSINGGAITTLGAGVAVPTAVRLGQNTLNITAIHAGMTKSYTVTVTRLPTVQQAYVKAGNNGAGDLFGTSVALSGDTLVVGAPSEAGGVAGVSTNPSQPDNTKVNSGATYVYRRTGSTWTFEAYLKASVPDAGDLFGQAVAIDGDILAVGAPAEDGSPYSAAVGTPDNNADGSGAAYVFCRENGQWRQCALLKASNAGSRLVLGFGSAVAVSGTTIAVGVPQEKSNGTGAGGDQNNVSMANAGAVYVFAPVGQAWAQQAYIKASNTGSQDLFGASVGLSGDTLVVGAPGEASKASGVNGSQANDSAAGAGAAYVFARSGATWSQQAYLKASNPDAQDNFGLSVGVSGNAVIVGAPKEDGNGLDPFDNSRTDSGAAYLFVRSGTNWTQQGYLKASAADAGDAFGTAVAIDGDSTLIGSPGESGGSNGVDGDPADNSQPSAGAAYLFTRSGVAWQQSAYIKASNAEANDVLGKSVAMDGNTAVAGASGEAGSAVFGAGGQGDNSAASAGAVYVFSGDSCFFGQASECDDGRACTTDVCGVDQLCQHGGVIDGATCGGLGVCQAQACTCSAGLLFNGSCGPVLTSLSTSAGVPVQVATGVSAAVTLSQGEYFLTVPYGQSTLTVTATANVGTAMTVSLNGGGPAVLTSGVPSPSLALAPGVNSVAVAATLAGQSTVYLVRVRRNWAQQDAYVKSSAPAVSQYFGTAVAVDGSTMVVASRSGTASIFVRDGSGIWSPQANLGIGSAGASGGLAVAVSGDTIVASVPTSLNGAAATVFVRSGTTWTQQAALSPPIGGAYYGAAVAIEGDTIVVGAPSEDTGGNTSGAAFVYTRTGITWTLQGTLKGAPTTTYAMFGWALSISGDTIAVGASNDQNGVAWSGSVFVFVRNAGVWSQQALLKATNAQGFDFFGGAVSISGDTLVASAWSDNSSVSGVVNGTSVPTDDSYGNTSGNGAGAAYVFVRTGSTWQQQAYLKSAMPRLSDNLGASVAISGNTIAVGVPGESSGAVGIDGNPSSTSQAASGAVYAYTRTGTTWSLRSYIKSSNSQAGDNFVTKIANNNVDGGDTSYCSVALSGTTLVVGAAGEDSNATGVNGDQANNSVYNSGAAYVFTLAGP